MSGAAPRRVGRPRDEAMDARALDAAVELLGEVGFEGTTIQAVAARSEVHASAIYRRWSSRVELIEAAVSPILSTASFDPTGDLDADVRRFVRAYERTFDSPAARAAIPGLLSHYQSHGSRRDAAGWLPISARPQFHDILRAAPEGTVDPAVDADDVFDVLLGALLARVVVPTVAERSRPLERTVELALKMVRRPGPASVETPAAGRRRTAAGR